MYSLIGVSSVTGQLDGAVAAADADALPGERLVHRRRRGPGDAAQHRVGGLRAERDRGLAAHPQRLVGRCGGIPGSDDARIVDAGQRFVGEQPAQRIGAKPAAGGQVRHAEPRRPHRHRAGQHGTVGEHHRIPAHLADRGGFEHVDAELAQLLGHRTAAGPAQRRAQDAATDQGHRAALLGEFGGGFDSGQAAADDGDGRVGMQLGQCVAQPLRALQFGEQVGVFGCAGHRGRCRAGAADGIDQVVVVQRGSPRPADPAAAASMWSALSTTSRMPLPSSVP